MSAVYVSNEMLVFADEGKPEDPERNPRSKDRNEQQTQFTCDAGNRTRVVPRLPMNEFFVGRFL